jgi:branched-subunit amino acid aminotransferase/4-amino-4-deoxychorismate lyase
MGEITPILEADGRKIGDGTQGSITKKIQSLHSDYAFKNGEQVPFSKPE